jgi:hypothetical protein
MANGVATGFIADGFLTGDQIEVAAARRADHVVQRAFVNNLNVIGAVWTANVHECGPDWLISNLFISEQRTKPGVVSTVGDQIEPFSFTP